MSKKHLRHKLHEGLSFGPDNELQFGVKGGFAPGEIIVDEDHPLYDQLIELEGSQLEEVSEGPTKVYSDVLGTDAEFPSKQALMAHVRAQAKAGNALAIAYLEANGNEKDKAALDENADATEDSTTGGIVVRDSVPLKKPTSSSKRRSSLKRRQSGSARPGSTSPDVAAPKTSSGSSSTRPSPTPDSTGPETPVVSGGQTVSK